MFAVYNRTTGELVSVGSDIADPMPEHLAAVELASTPDLSTVQWDTESRTFVPTVPQAGVQDLQRDEVAAMLADARAAGATQDVKLNALVDVLALVLERLPAS